MTLINAIIDRNGSPYAINIEVAYELNRSFIERAKVRKKQDENEKNRLSIKQKIADLLGVAPSAVSERQVDCYRLGEQQSWQSLYSGKHIDMLLCLQSCVDPNSSASEIDHIVPYSFILDNTLQNKALVYASENQAKGQRTPLEYLSGEAAEQFRGRVNSLYNTAGGKANRISRRKYEYLMQESSHDAVLGEWKSRNINDTRYISKFLVRYLRKNLLINHDEDESYRRQDVYAVKGAITSQMRRLWLNEKTWGCKDKTALKDITLLDHAADAVVIACCQPAYAEIASVQRKLRNIFKTAKTENDEYCYTMRSCIDTMTRYYGMNPGEVERLLRRRDRTPCLINNLQEEVDIRFIEPHTFRIFGNEEQKAMSDKQILALYHEKCKEHYFYDTAFADSLQPVIVSHKPNLKVSHSITDETAISVRIY